MKFIIDGVAGKTVATGCATAAARAGQLEVRSSLPVLDTPAPLIRCRGGAIPHLTHETLQYLDTANRTLLIPYQYHSTQTDVLKAYQKGLGSFLGEKDRMSMLTVQDPGEETKSGYNQNKAISVWSGCNRNIVDVDGYKQFVRVAQPDIVVPLCDGDTPPDSTSKRINKAAKRTIDFLDSFLELKDENPKMNVVAAVEGGLDPVVRKLSAIETSKRNVDAFLLDGFHSNGTAAESLRWEAIKEPFLETIFHLPAEKPRFFLGPAGPRLLLELVSAGVDVFDTSYPNLVTERNAFLVFNNKFTKDWDPLEGADNHDLMFEKNFENDEMKMEMRSLVEGCSCYTCRNFTVAYLYHLVHVKEMLAKVLLSLHNLHHYLTFFKSIREAILADQIHLLHRQILQPL
eukprot:TRINITY_DN4132_c0_g1_i4.p1 TRINITY_DN4132_c0_g1~~TRINITY_DN4132_c0_g1_i4.p1  ORF type:complete len:401 (-),score=78.58 TRINITY_DN4132_c0_g1_i4:93-1295(-)